MMLAAASGAPAIFAEPGAGVCASRSIHLSRLVVTDFRSYERASLSLDGRPAVLTGENGAGKTNLLEAVSLLAPGRGLRGAAYAEIARDGGAGGWAVAATVETAAGPLRIGTGIEPSLSGGEAPRSRACGSTAWRLRARVRSRGMCAFSG